MKPETRDLLISAHRENRLAGLHIDMQENYVGGRDLPVSGAVRMFSEVLRAIHVNNIWIAFAHGHAIKRIPDGITTVENYNATALPGDVISREAGARLGETVIVKSNIDALGKDSSYLDPYLQKEKIDTILVTGFTGICCVGRTIGTAIRMDRYNVIAVQDCIDQADGWPYDRYVRNEVGDKSAFQKRFHMASSMPIFRELARKAQPLSNDCNFPVPAV